MLSVALLLSTTICKRGSVVLFLNQQKTPQTHASCLHRSQINVTSVWSVLDMRDIPDWRSCGQWSRCDICACFTASKQSLHIVKVIHVEYLLAALVISMSDAHWCCFSAQQSLFLMSLSFVLPYSRSSGANQTHSRLSLAYSADESCIQPVRLNKNLSVFHSKLWKVRFILANRFVLKDSLSHI